MAHLSNTEFQSLNIAVLTVSDTRDIDSDTSGQALIDGLTNAGHSLAERAIVKDDIWQIRARVCSWIASESVQVVLITGGTGVTARDNTPQAVQPLLDKDVDGFGELFRHFSLGEIGT
ncbi:MAG: molybdenum cofactor biosynthesis protein, partial [Pseudomonas sp.]|nr:molybdenum cofactor biosynthesis protein [Pseudomonas sp.]